MTPDEAVEIARPWALASVPSSGGDIGLYEFDLGFVAWAKVPPSDPSLPPAVMGAPLAVVDKETGELTQWPSLSPQHVADLYRREAAARTRLPEDVRRVLTAAGWRSDRDVNAWVSSWLRDLYAADAEAAEHLPIHPAARSLLDEFGGLSFRQLKQPGSTSGGYDVQFWPTQGRIVTDLFTEFAAELGTPVFPLAWYEDGPSDIAVAADGRVFLLHEAGEFLVGTTPDEAIVRLVRGEPFTPFET
ncbi:SUKH-3 domain-containing protein [Dactylosporangium roseum]|uniref:SUKH-3 domain-containing protein n=1 Tax=Dactylosporangium roseum TaxID=47989 RepID=A0ABY5ZB66_9ACTN|nr:SUKH-3 domain-containing protein [Dactylosporangium roseum]UWZ38914.1 SUKH-3 domain-containing protein [Dactylosporangium roseum]